MFFIEGLPVHTKVQANAIEGIEINFTKPVIAKILSNDVLTVTWYYKDSFDFILLSEIVNEIKKVAIVPPVLNLFAPYLPDMQFLFTNTADFINNFHFNRVDSYNVDAALKGKIERLESEDRIPDLIESIFIKEREPQLFTPDNVVLIYANASEANHNYSKFANYHAVANYTVNDKGKLEVQFTGGNVLTKEQVGVLGLDGKKFIIVSSRCTSGSKFNAILSALYDKGIKTVKDDAYLVATHLDKAYHRSSLGNLGLFNKLYHELTMDWNYAENCVKLPNSLPF